MIVAPGGTVPVVVLCGLLDPFPPPSAATAPPAAPAAITPAMIHLERDDDFSEGSAFVCWIEALAAPPLHDAVTRM